MSRPLRQQLRWPWWARLIVATVIVVLCVSLWTFWTTRRPAAARIYADGLAALNANDLGAVQVAVEALAGMDETAGYTGVLRGAIDLRQGRLKQAVTRFLQARKRPEVAAVANMLAGESLYRNRQYREAIDALQQAVTTDPGLTDAHRRLAAVYYDIGASAPALEQLKEVAELAPNDPRPYRLIGLIYKDQEAFANAAKAYQEALRRDPHLPEREDVLLELAECQLSAWQHDEFAETIRQCPRTAAALAMEAQAQFKLGNPAAAKKLADDALLLEPNHLEAQLLKGTLELLAGDAAAAADTLQAATTAHPYDYRVHYKLSQVYSRLNQKADADQHAHRATELRRLREQFADLHARASVDTQNAELRFQLGQMAAQLGRHDLAVSWYTNALALDPKLAAAQTALQSESHQLRGIQNDSAAGAK